MLDVPSLPKTMTPSAMLSRMAWFLLASACSRARASARSMVRSSTRRSSSRYEPRRSASAFSRLRADSHEIRATVKKPSMAGTFGTIPSLRATMVITRLLSTAMAKLAHGRSNTLAMRMGMASVNRLRPFTTCWGSSVVARAAMSNSKKRLLANQPGPYRLSKKTTRIPARVARLPRKRKVISV